MSNIGLSMADESANNDSKPRRKRPKRKGRSGIAIFITAVVVLGIIGVVGYSAMWVFDELRSAAPVADYPGPGGGEVIVEVSQGDTLTQMGTKLFQVDVVESAEAFSLAAVAIPEATSITPGSYVMLKKMSGQGAVERLMDPAARNENSVLIQEGLRTDQTVTQLSSATGIKKAEFYKVIKSPELLPLPTWARGTGEARAEGFLFPATYKFKKDMTAKDILNMMVARFDQMATETNFVADARKTSFSPYEVLTIASLVQAEGTGEDYADISSALYNRLDPNSWGGTYGLLNVDATINYIFKRAELNFAESDKESDSPYNTYKFPGLPPTPINSPGEAAIAAVLNPEKSEWLYWVHGPEGQTCLATNYADHQNNVTGECKWE
jgi:UPF0755 protein